MRKSYTVLNLYLFKISIGYKKKKNTAAVWSGSQNENKGMTKLLLMSFILVLLLAKPFVYPVYTRLL